MTIDRAIIDFTSSPQQNKKEDIMICLLLGWRLIFRMSILHPRRHIQTCQMYKKAYTTPEDMKSLRYGKVMIMADQVIYYSFKLIVF